MKTKGGLVRIIILAIILSATVTLEILHLYGSGSYPSAHAVCPLGGLENLWAWFAGQSNLQKLFSGTMTLFFFTLVFALIFGRSFCGNLCPFGGLFEFAGKLTRKKYTLPPSVDKPLRYLKYVILVFITYMAWKTATLWISPYDPYAAFAHSWKGAEVFNEYFIGFLILVACLLLSLAYERFFCKYLCPAGALYGVVSKISPLKIKRNPCIQCNKCSMKCPMNIDVANSGTVKSAECIACGICVSVCPNPSKYIGFSFFKKTPKPLTVVLVSAIVFFGSILVFDSLGLYQVSVPTIQQVEQEGTFIKIGDLRGSMSIEIGAQYTGKSLEDFYAIMEIPETVAKETLLKEISQQVPNYDFHVMKAKKANE
jgi:polyferredoxin